jgi:hypothetical protein
MSVNFTITISTPNQYHLLASGKFKINGYNIISNIKSNINNNYNKQMLPLDLTAHGSKIKFIDIADIIN